MITYDRNMSLLYYPIDKRMNKETREPSLYSLLIYFTHLNVIYFLLNIFDVGKLGLQL